MKKTLLNSLWFKNVKRKALVQMLMFFTLLLEVSALQAQSKHYVAGNIYINTAGFVYITSGDTVVLEKTIKTIRDTAAAKRGMLSFAGTAGWKSTNSSFVNGYVRTRNTTAFIFPVGQSVYRPAAISAAAPDMPTDAAYYETALFDISSLGNNVDAITNESWIIQGTRPTNITLSWSTDMTVFASNNIANIFVVGWDPITNKWEKIASTIDPVSIFGISSSLGSGSVTTLAAIAPNSYAAYTLGGYKPYTVTFNDNGDINTRITIEGDSIGSANMPDEPTRHCYEFENWYFDLDDESSLFTSATVVTSDTTVYAKWIDLHPAAPVIINVTNTNVCEGDVITVLFLQELVSSGEGITLEFYIDVACTELFTDIITDRSYATSHDIYVIARNIAGCTTPIENALKLTITVGEICYITLDLKVFLQGVIQPSSPPFMTNHIQVPLYPTETPDLKLPVVNPYGIPGSYFQINDTLGVAGKVVDWILVEIWGNLVLSGMNTRYDLFEKLPLLLKPDGNVVDTNGLKPKLVVCTDSEVRIVVKHRNHMTVVSSALFPFNEDITYDFSIEITQALRAPLAIYDPMVMYNGLACLWAGDLNMNEFMDNVDMSIFNIDWRTRWIGEYVASDVNMDGMVNNIDNSFIIRNTKLGLYSPVYFFMKKN